MTYRRIHIICIIALLQSAMAWAQQFGVGSFRQLPNDITAYIDPVRDLNDEACALVKVVCSHDFAFSSPLGIVKRKNKDGEVWLYLPRGTSKLTLKHPAWGVLRDYLLPKALESRMTYELTLVPPEQAMGPSSEQPLVPMVLRQDTFIVVMNQQPARVPLSLRLQAGLATNGHHVMTGLRLSGMRQHGLYAAFFSDFQSLPTMKDVAAPQTYDTGTACTRQRLLCGGLVHRLSPWLFLYEGAGWGKHLVAWQQADGLWLKRGNLSYEGWAAEAGLGCEWKRLSLSVGAQTIVGRVWTCSLGLGWRVEGKR